MTPRNRHPRNRASPSQAPASPPAVTRTRSQSQTSSSQRSAGGCSRLPSRRSARLARRRAGHARLRGGGDAVASASYADESGVWALEVAGERCLDGRPPHGCAQESLYPRVHVASLHRVALVDQHLRDGVDDLSLPWMRGADRSARSSGSASSTVLASGLRRRWMASFSKASSGAGGLEWCPLRSTAERPVIEGEVTIPTTSDRVVDFPSDFPTGPWSRREGCICEPHVAQDGASWRGAACDKRAARPRRLRRARPCRACVHRARPTAAALLAASGPVGRATWAIHRRPHDLGRRGRAGISTLRPAETRSTARGGALTIR